MAQDTQRVKSAGQRPKKPRAPAGKKTTSSSEQLRLQNARAAKYRAACKRAMVGHHEYALDLASRAAVAADLMLEHPDPEIRLTAIGRACRASQNLIEAHNNTVVLKRLEALEARANAK